MFDTVDDEALTKEWENIQQKPFQCFQTALDIIFPAYHRNDTIHNFLLFLKLFSTHRYKFEKSVDNLITFCDVINSTHI